MLHFRLNTQQQKLKKRKEKQKSHDNNDLNKKNNNDQAPKGHPIHIESIIFHSISFFSVFSIYFVYLLGENLSVIANVPVYFTSAFVIYIKIKSKCLLQCHFEINLNHFCQLPVVIECDFVFDTILFFLNKKTKTNMPHSHITMHSILSYDFILNSRFSTFYTFFIMIHSFYSYCLFLFI